MHNIYPFNTKLRAQYAQNFAAHTSHSFYTHKKRGGFSFPFVLRRLTALYLSESFIVPDAIVEQGKHLLQ